MKEAGHLPPVTSPAFVFSLSGCAGMSVDRVTDLVQAAHSCVTLRETVQADGQITHTLNHKCSAAFTELNLLSIVLSEVRTVLR